MKLTLYRIVLVLLVVASLAFITYNSLQNADKSSSMSNSISEDIAEIVVPDYGQLPENEKEAVVKKISIPIRDIAHLIEFAMSAFFLMLLLSTVKFNYGRYPVAIVVTILFCFAYALFDEWLQSFVAGRGTQWEDVWADSLGSTIGTVFAVLVDLIGLRLSYSRGIKKKFKR